MYMLDTDICIYIINNHPIKLKDKLNKHFDKLVISSITLAELMFGVEKSKNQSSNLQNVLDFRRNVDVLFFGDKAAVEYGIIRAELDKKGKPIGPNDTLIAAHARSIDAILVTNNSKEYKRVQGLRIEKWL
jgi:tRNA(fMet)-specific endonuclease VapC